MSVERRTRDEVADGFPRLRDPKPPRRPGMRRRSEKARAENAELEAAKKTVRARSGGRCEAPVHAERCSGRATEVHHLMPRSVADRSTKHEAENLMHLSWECHRWATDCPEAALEAGMLRRSWDANR